MRTKLYISAMAVIAGGLLLAVSGCSEKIVNDQPQLVAITVQAKIGSPLVSQAVDHFQVIVMTEDAAQTVTALLDLVEGVLVGKVEVPAGYNRTFLVMGVDKENMPIYAGEATADVWPDAVVKLDIYLRPVAPLLYFQPHYQKLPMDSSFQLDVYAAMIPEISGISFEVSYNSAPIYLESVLPGYEIDTTSTYFSYYEGDNQVNISLAPRGAAAPVAITDAAGTGHLATIVFGSYYDWPYDTATVDLTAGALTMYGMTGDSVSTASVNTDVAKVELYYIPPEEK